MANKKMRGLVYNISKIEKTTSGYNIRVDYTKDGQEKAPRMFEKLSDALYWISEINMVAHRAFEVQININLK